MERDADGHDQCMTNLRRLAGSAWIGLLQGPMLHSGFVVLPEPYAA